MKLFIKIILLLFFFPMFLIAFVGGVIGSLVSGEDGLIVNLVITVILGGISYQLFRWKTRKTAEPEVDSVSPKEIVPAPEDSEMKAAPVAVGLSKDRKKLLKKRYKKQVDKSSDKYLNGYRSLSSSASRGYEPDISRSGVDSIPNFDDRFNSVYDGPFVSFLYPGKNGTETREVAVKKQLDGEYINGFCETAIDFRTFKIDRIIGDIVNLETGEVYGRSEFGSRMLQAGGGYSSHHDGEARETISFVGFNTSIKQELVTLAKLNGFAVKNSNFTGLDYFCYGPNCSKAKKEEAELDGVELLDEDDFRICKALR